MTKSSQEVWDPGEVELTKTLMDGRIKSCCSYLGWQHAIKFILDKGIPFEKLNVAEVGCGTGTFSLTLGLLGASVTLIDYNDKVLERTKKAYSLYNCEATFIKADCLEKPPAEITRVFDFVISGGLAEHFSGENRSRCIKYHELLLKEGGFAFIGVPNKFSPFYRWIVFFRKLTGTWRIDIEIPFSPSELRRIAESLGFKEYYIKGNAPLSRDLVDYSRGFISAMVDILPIKVGKKVRKVKANIKTRNKSELQSPSEEDMKGFCLSQVEQIKHSMKPKYFLADKFSAGIILFAFK